MYRIYINSIYKFEKHIYKSRHFYNFKLQTNKPRDSNECKITNIISHVSLDIISNISSNSDNLNEVIRYSFSASGKMIRPQIIIWVAAALNEQFIAEDTDKLFYNNNIISPLNESQYKIALIAEMIHTASLMHDDLIDFSSIRRGLKSAHVKFGPEKTILGGDYILIRASQLLAKIGNCDAVTIIAQLINDLIKGEIMQLTRYDDIDEKFAHYYKKTYKKTASLIANSCKAVCLLSVPTQLSEKTLQAAYEFGRNLGMAFQLIDDIFDVTSSQEQLGKPCQLADIKLGLATGPILFASEQFPEVEEMVIRKLAYEGDTERLLFLVDKAKGVEKTRIVAKMHHDAALRILSTFKPSYYRTMLEKLSNDILTRTK